MQSSILVVAEASTRIGIFGVHGGLEVYVGFKGLGCLGLGELGSRGVLEFRAPPRAITHMTSRNYWDTLCNKS